MGVKFLVTKDDLPKEFQKYPLIPTKDGISDTVYLLGNDYVLKVFEFLTDEENILSILKGLPVPKVVKSFFIRSKQALIFTQIKGVSTDKYPLEVVKFLKNMHFVTKNKTTKNPKIFTQEKLEEMLKTAQNSYFYKLYKELEDIRLQNHGIIHGDLFPDNAKFIKDKLSGVFDFSQACEGDFYFDLGVVCFSFKANIDEVLKIYNADIDKKSFLKYIKIARLYYSLNRYIHKQKDYKELLW